MIERKDEEHTLPMREVKSEAHELRNQVAALAQMIDKLSTKMKSKPTRRTKRRPSFTPTASSDEESESGSEDEPPKFELQVFHLYSVNEIFAKIAQDQPRGTCE